MSILTYLIDRLRGRNKARDAESMEFARKLKEARLNKPVLEMWAGHPDWKGNEPVVIDLAGKDEQEIKGLLAKYRGMYYTGRVKTYGWRYKRAEHFNCLAETVYVQDGKYVHSWQGPNPPSGYYGQKNLWYVIDGEEPKIMGINYQI